MGSFFPRWTNILPLKIAAAFFLLVMGAGAAITVYWTNKYSRVGYQPDQPIPYDHELHVGQLGLDCRYCHSFVEESSHANVPTAQTCWNCHQFVKKESDLLRPLREAMDETWEGYTGKPIEWVRIHQVPDYAYFSHQVHVNRGVSCVSCHGKINEMPVVYQHESQSMGWCLDCHREPSKHLRPLDEITNLDWKPEDEDRGEFYDHLAAHSDKTAEELMEWIKNKHGINPEGPMTQKEIGTQLEHLWGVQHHESCTACHR